MSHQPAAVPFVGLEQQSQRLRAAIEQRFSTILDHGKYVMGPEVSELEQALAQRVGGGVVVACSSGTDALLMPLIAEEVGPGDAVFVPSFTFTATAEVAMLCGAEPVFVDVDPESYNISPASLEEQLAAVKNAGRLRPRAVLAVDLFGLPADYPTLLELCAREGLLLIDDAAQSFGAALGPSHEEAVGRLAPYTGTSFYPAKPLGGYGDGGAIFCQEERQAEVLASVRQHGYGERRYEIVRLGLNGRLDSLQAAVLLEKLVVFSEELEARDQLARAYTRGLGSNERVQCPLESDPEASGGLWDNGSAACAWAQYTIQVDERDAVQSRLKAGGVPSVVYYPLPMHLQPAYAAYGNGAGSLPVSERLCTRVLSLPMKPLPDRGAHPAGHRRGE